MYDLRWLGLDWDEGPDVGGPYGPYFQSERVELYQRMGRQLVNEGKAYYCYCSPERLAEMRKEQEARKESVGYDRHCRDLTPEEAERLRAECPPPVVRFKMPSTGSTIFNDVVRGEILFDNSLQDDFVILKSDGFPTYHFASVVDDHDIDRDSRPDPADKPLQVVPEVGRRVTGEQQLEVVLRPRSDYFQGRDKIDVRGNLCRYAKIIASDHFVDREGTFLAVHVHQVCQALVVQVEVDEQHLVFPGQDVSQGKGYAAFPYASFTADDRDDQRFGRAVDHLFFLPVSTLIAATSSAMAWNFLLIIQRFPFLVPVVG
jgi:hypothetical protein